VPAESLLPGPRQRQLDCRGVESFEHARQVKRRSTAAAQCYTASAPADRRHRSTTAERSNGLGPRTTSTNREPARRHRRNKCVNTQRFDDANASCAELQPLSVETATADRSSTGKAPAPHFNVLSNHLVARDCPDARNSTGQPREENELFYDPVDSPFEEQSDSELKAGCSGNCADS
jgi:hypothetical protein